jgi:hypothetical protein
MPIQVAVEFESITGKPEDKVVNTWTIMGAASGTLQVDLVEIELALAEFYNAAPAGQPGSLAEVMSLHLSRAANGMTYRFYDLTSHLDGSAHGAPFFTTYGTLGPAAAGSVSLPSEVAIALTLKAGGRDHAAVETNDGPDAGTERDRPMERRTGRVYLGPWTTNAIDNVTPFLKPSSVTRTTIAKSAQRLANRLQAHSPSFNLGVWSRKDGTVRSVAAVAVDDAWDTQRRRGIDRSARLELAVNV